MTISIWWTEDVFGLPSVYIGVKTYRYNYEGRFVLTMDDGSRIVVPNSKLIHRYMIEHPR